MKEDTLWRHFSLFIRLRDSDENGIAKCFTCGRAHHYKEMDAAHYISRRHMSTKYNQRNVHACCVYCNKWLSGNLVVYSRNLDIKYGEGTALKLEIESKQLKKLSQFEIKAMSDHYRNEAKKLLKTKTT